VANVGPAPAKEDGGGAAQPHQKRCRPAYGLDGRGHHFAAAPGLDSAALSLVQGWIETGGTFMSRKCFAALGFVTLFIWAGQAAAGDLVGTVSAPKPDRAVVFVEGVKGTFPAKDQEIDQKGKLFVPYVLPLLKGTKVIFRNDDPLAHNVFGVGADEFNLGTFSKGASRDHTFTKTGDTTLLCNVHPEMEGHVLVLDNPFFAQPDTSGKFQISGVPAGEYVLKAWYGGKVKKQTVKVPASGTVSVTF
jgi:plastocyanin